jgi:putative membrane-bound dehydrogenase-like protein
MQSLRRPALLVAVPLVTLITLFAAQSTAATTEPTIRKEDLPRLPAVEPQNAVKTLKVRPGFHAELAAAEPNVIDPVAMCFDENGRMFVVEMRDYSERRAEKLGRIRMLEDKDGDGVYETSTVFVDHLPWPTALLWCNGGLLIGACPDILFAKDTNNDGVADETKTLFTGFGSTQDKLNVQGLFNNFQWGPDNRIHGCSGHDGGMIEANQHPTTQPLDVRNKGFVIDPRDWTMTTESGGGQYGLSFDPSGRLFTCENSSHCQLFMYDARYAARNPYVTLPDPRISIAADGPAAEVFRASPEEPWRVVRTRWRVAGLVGGPVEGGGRSAGYFTGATGITIYRGDAFGDQYLGDAFIGDAGGNLVHHKHITPGPDGIEPIAARPDDERKIEFCASTDTWFRPVDFANAPDGCLYVCDMYREVIEHPWSLPPSIKQFLDLNSGNDRGRIYRLAPDNFKRRPPPKLGSATTAELVALLEHPNGWHRETASRLLFERQDPSATGLLIKLLESSTNPTARMVALYSLDGLGAVTESVILRALADSDPLVQQHAIALSERLLAAGAPSDALWAALKALAGSPAITVRYQLAFTLGSTRHPQRAELLANLAERDGGNLWMRTAILSSLADCAGEVFAQLARSENNASAAALLPPLARLIAARQDVGDLRAAKEFTVTGKSRTLRFAVARALYEGATQVNATNSVRVGTQDVINEAKSIITQNVVTPSREQLQAIELLGYAHQADDALGLLQFPSPSLQLAALDALDRADMQAMPAAVEMNWPKLTPRAQTEAVTLLLKRPQRAVELLQAIERKSIPSTALNAQQAALARNHPDATVKALAMKALPPPASRDSVVGSFKPALDLKGDSSHGKSIYEQRCISCHRAAGEGNAVGPDLVTVKNGGKEKLLLSILDPSREVAPNYVAYLIESKDGDSALGILTTDTPTSITVRQAYAKESIIPRAAIRRMTSQGKSLMPDGLEVGLKPQDLADLISFIESQK